MTRPLARSTRHRASDRSARSARVNPSRESTHIALTFALAVPLLGRAGPHDGRYGGENGIRALWQKFAAANDALPRTLTRGTVTQNAIRRA